MPQSPSAKSSRTAKSPSPAAAPRRASARKASAPKTGPLAIALTGDLTIQTIGAAHAQLREAFAAGRPVRVDVAADATVDLTLPQLLEAARRTAAGAGLDFALAAPAAGALLETLNRGGFTQTAEQRAFWLAQTGEA